jgi:hypothetical protein
MIVSALYKMGERNSYPFAPIMTIIPAAPHPSFPRKRESTAPGSPHFQPEAIHRITYDTAARRYCGLYIVLLT